MTALLQLPAPLRERSDGIGTERGGTSSDLDRGHKIASRERDRICRKSASQIVAGLRGNAPEDALVILLPICGKTGKRDALEQVSGFDRLGERCAECDRRLPRRRRVAEQGKEIGLTTVRYVCAISTAGREIALAGLRARG